MARPEKSADEKRKPKLEVRVTEAEKNQIAENARNAKRNVSDYIRELALHAKPKRVVPTPDRAALLKTLAELNMNGSNLNQIARALNRRQDSEDFKAVDIIALNRTIDKLETLVQQLLEILE